MTNGPTTASVRRHALLLRFLRHKDDRSTEWLSSLVMLTWAGALMLPGDTLAGPQYAAFSRFGMTEDAWAWAFALFGSARITALYINGRWPQTPRIRILCATFGAASWMQVSYLIYAGTWIQTGIMGTGPGVYAVLGLFDLLAIFRAAVDVRYYKSN